MLNLILHRKILLSESILPSSLEDALDEISKDMHGRDDIASVRAVLSTYPKLVNFPFICDDHDPREWWGWWEGILTDIRYNTIKSYDTFYYLLSTWDWTGSGAAAIQNEFARETLLHLTWIIPEEVHMPYITIMYELGYFELLSTREMSLLVTNLTKAPNYWEKGRHKNIYDKYKGHYEWLGRLDWSGVQRGRRRRRTE